MKTPFLVGETIYLRPLESEDGPEVAAWFREAEFGGRFANGLPVSEEAARRQIETLTRDERQIGLAVALRADDRLVGAVRLYRLSPQRRSGGCRLALAPASSFRGAAAAAREVTRLVLAYAFDTLNLNRVYVHLPASDHAARTRYAAAGFREEGILRQEAWRDGRYEDVAVLALLREEYGRT
ncbi:MAG TPA: GNAT family protein [Candidatus Eisenbacteria bacterium]|nr:GNAT family protein [Candidatus Eisenbacteria bacterium]